MAGTNEALNRGRRIGIPAGGTFVFEGDRWAMPEAGAGGGAIRTQRGGAGADTPLPTEAEPAPFRGTPFQQEAPELLDPFLRPEAVRPAEEQAAALSDVLLQQAPRFAEQAVGLQEQLLPRLQTLFQDLISRGRAGDIQDLLTLAPRLQEIRRAGEAPQATELRDLLLGETLSELQAGTDVRPEEARRVIQGFRGGELARGLGTGGGSAAREAVLRGLRGQDILERRLSRAQSVLGQEAAVSPDPFSAILGRPPTATAFAGGGLQRTPGGQLPLAAAQLGVGQAGQQRGLQQQGFFQALAQGLGIERGILGTRLALANQNLSEPERQAVLGFQGGGVQLPIG